MSVIGCVFLYISDPVNDPRFTPTPHPTASPLTPLCEEVVEKKWSTLIVLSSYSGYNGTFPTVPQLPTVHHAHIYIYFYQSQLLFHLNDFLLSMLSAAAGWPVSGGPAVVHVEEVSRPGPYAARERSHTRGTRSWPTTCALSFLQPRSSRAIPRHVHQSGAQDPGLRWVLQKKHRIE